MVTPYVFAFPLLYKHKGELVRKMLSPGTSMSICLHIWKCRLFLKAGFKALLLLFPEPTYLLTISLLPAVFCVTGGLWPEAAVTWTWIRSSLKECSKWEGRRWCNTLKGILCVKIVDYLLLLFCLTLPDGSTKESKPCTANWLAVCLRDSS